jgi:hypothetical protein
VKVEFKYSEIEIYQLKQALLESSSAFPVFC